MWKPIGEYMTVEKYQDDIGGLVLPDDMKPGEGDTFTVIAAGEGFYLESGQLIAPNIKPGDRVMIAGKLLRIPGEKKLLIARQADALAVQREDIPDKI